MTSVFSHYGQINEGKQIISKKLRKNEMITLLYLKKKKEKMNVYVSPQKKIRKDTSSHRSPHL